MNKGTRHCTRCRKLYKKNDLKYYPGRGLLCNNCSGETEDNISRYKQNNGSLTEHQKEVIYAYL